MEKRKSGLSLKKGEIVRIKGRGGESVLLAYRRLGLGISLSTREGGDVYYYISITARARGVALLQRDGINKNRDGAHSPRLSRCFYPGDPYGKRRGGENFLGKRRPISAADLPKKGVASPCNTIKGKTLMEMKGEGKEEEIQRSHPSLDAESSASEERPIFLVLRGGKRKEGRTTDAIRSNHRISGDGQEAFRRKGRGRGDSQKTC